METPIFTYLYFTLFLNLKHIQSISTDKQVFQFCLHAM